MTRAPWFASVVLNFTIVAQAAPLNLVVVEGDGAINNIRLQRAKEPMVRVEDENGKPVGGADVTFVAPTVGPGAIFVHAGASLTLRTDDRGEAVGRGLQPNRTAGTFQIRVIAVARGQTARTEISQTNVEPASRSHSRTYALVALIGGAAAGAIAASHGGKTEGSSAATPAVSPGTTVVPGTPSFGPPH